MTRSAERSVHLSFVVSPWAKAAIALFEIVGGVAALFVTKQILVDLAVWVTRLPKTHQMISTRKCFPT